MKYLVLLCMLCIQTYTLAYIDQVSFGLGSYSQHLGTIEESIGGQTNSFEHNIYFNSRAELDWVLFNSVAMSVELGITLPRSSRDSAVSEINYWSTFLFSTQHKLADIFRPHFGLGFLFTRLSMDGTAQDLSNAGTPTTFQTPDGPSTAWNNIVILGVDSYITAEIFLGTQVFLTNIEDSQESSKTFLLSLNYNFGTP